VTSSLAENPVAPGGDLIPIVDADVHNYAVPLSPELDKYMSKRWVEYLQTMGMFHTRGGGERPRQRQYAHRTDSIPPGGGRPGTDPAFAREQLLDLYGMSGAILNDIAAAALVTGSDSCPLELSLEIVRAYNDWRVEWFESDPRWYASINVPFESPSEAVKEIERCREHKGADGDRFVQVMFCGASDEPIGRARYWPIFEACEHYGIPVGIHAAGGKRGTPCGHTNFYFEDHTDFALVDFPIVASLIFEGVFDRFPSLQVALLELGWSWVVPFGWRLDASWRVLREEVPHLQRKPSDYIRNHFWLTTQPMEEPDHPEFLKGVYELMCEAGMDERLMYSSDYPHWDFDPPEALDTMPVPMRRKVLGRNASELYGIPLLDGVGARARAASRA